MFFDHRPLSYEEFMGLVKKAILVSATPSSLDIELSEGLVVEQLIRPTGIVDPAIRVVPTKNQVRSDRNAIHIAKQS